MIIYDKNNIERCEIKSLEYNGEFMGERFVSVTIKSPFPIDFELGDYIDYRGERFTLNYDPSIIKKAEIHKSGEAFIYENVKFNSYADELLRCEFLDYVLNDNLIHFSSLPTFGFHALTIQDLADRIKANLDRVYPGLWTVNVDSDVEVKNVFISADKLTVWGALALVSTTFKSNFIIRGRTITIGTAGNVIDNVFEYGKGKGLNKITKIADPEQQIITRLRVYGSTRNLPLRYYNKLTSPLPSNMAVQNLMLPSFPYTTLDPYLDSPNIGELGVMEGSIFFDGSNNLPEIYPSLEGMTASELISAGIPVDLDSGDNGNLDEIVAITNEDGTPITDDGLFEEGETIPPFKLTIKDIGFDINDYLSGETATISLRTGMNGGREFEILSCEKVGNKYVLTCNRTEDIGRFFPYSSMNINAGDKFVLLNIEMPEVYIQAASQRLLEAGQAYLSKNDYVRYTYQVNISPVYMARNPIDLIEGDYLMFADTDLGISGSIIIDTLRIKDDGVPTYEVTLTEEKQVGTLQKLQNQINYLLSGSGGSVDLKQTESLIKLIGSKKFLSRINPDTAQGFIEFLKGISVEELATFLDGLTSEGLATLLKGFISKSHSYIEAALDVDKKLTAKEGLQIGASFAGGLTGHGGTIDEGGNAELQSLILRTYLEVPELRFNRVDVIAGDLWNTRGAGIIEEVDTVNQIITLKLEKGEIGRFRYDDIVMGIFHSLNDADNSVDDYDDGLGNRRYSGFGTSYFRVTQILDAERYSKFRYELRPISARYPKQFHPQPFMTSAAYGNFTNAERQTSMYQTTSYIRLLRNVNNWEFGIENIGMQWGDLSNLSIFGLDMTGYSAYMENVYFSGIIHQLSAKIKEQLDAQRVGGKNLLREYDIRFGFKYWGNAGEYTEFDINQIESTPQLQVQPNTLNWTFPIRYGTIVITANGVWSITTPSWLNAYPAAGSGNKNVDLKAGEYKGRDARTGMVAIQSGVIQRNVSISQAGLPEFVTIDPILNVGYEAQTVTITGRSNSSKLTFTTDTGYLEINLPAQYKVNGANVNNGSLIAGDPGALDEYSFSITVAVGENVEDFSIQNNIFATANGGQKAISTIVQRRARVKVLGDTDNSIISIGDMIFHIN